MKINVRRRRELCVPALISLNARQVENKSKNKTMMKLETMRMTMLKMRRARRTKAGGRRGNWISIVAS